MLYHYIIPDEFNGVRPFYVENLQNQFWHYSGYMAGNGVAALIYNAVPTNVDRVTNYYPRIPTHYGSEFVYDVEIKVRRWASTGTSPNLVWDVADALDDSRIIIYSSSKSYGTANFTVKDAPASTSGHLGWWDAAKMTYFVKGVAAENMNQRFREQFVFWADPRQTPSTAQDNHSSYRLEFKFVQRRIGGGQSRAFYGAQNVLNSNGQHLKPPFVSTASRDTSSWHSNFPGYNLAGSNVGFGVFASKFDRNKSTGVFPWDFEGKNCLILDGEPRDYSKDTGAPFADPRSFERNDFSQSPHLNTGVCAFEQNNVLYYFPSDQLPGSPHNSNESGSHAPVDFFEVGGHTGPIFNLKDDPAYRYDATISLEAWSRGAQGWRTVQDEAVGGWITFGSSGTVYNESRELWDASRAKMRLRNMTAANLNSRLAALKIWSSKPANTSQSFRIVFNFSLFINGEDMGRFIRAFNILPVGTITTPRFDENWIGYSDDYAKLDNVGFAGAMGPGGNVNTLPGQPYYYYFNSYSNDWQ